MADELGDNPIHFLFCVLYIMHFKKEQDLALTLHLLFLHVDFPMLSPIQMIFVSIRLVNT